MFCLFYDAKTKKVSAMNGSGRTSMKSTLENVRSRLGITDGEEGKIPLKDAHSITVPGAAAGWVDTVERFGSGKLTLEQILAPAIELAEKGFPVSELSSGMASSFLCDTLFSRLTKHSGVATRICSRKHPQISPNNSKQILQLPKAIVVLSPEKSSRIPISRTHSELSLKTARKDSTLVQSPNQ